MNKWMKKLTAALCAAVLMCGMAVTAYAGGGDMGTPQNRKILWGEEEQRSRANARRKAGAAVRSL